MPIRYIGRANTYKGKTLFEILLQLKNFGIGRTVVRDTFAKRYPQPSYYVITKVFADMSDPELRKGHAWARRVFRGKESEEEWKLSTGHKPDWRLLSKEEEATYCVLESVEEPKVKVVPNKVVCPPLLRMMVESEMKKNGVELKEPFSLDIEIQKGFAHNAVQEKELSAGS